MSGSQIIDLLFTADRNYVNYIAIVLKSLQINDFEVQYRVHLIHDDLNTEQQLKFQYDCISLGYEAFTYQVNDAVLLSAPVNKHYAPAMYYRLLAGEILPDSVKKVIYLDPDLLIINPLHPLWEINMDQAVFLAASHTEEIEIIDNFNRLRLNTSSSYFNTGVMVIDLEKMRQVVQKKDIYDFIDKNAMKLLLPDQDVFNALYGHLSNPIPDTVWNYDVRKYKQYFVRSGGITDDRWIMQNTAILHFCGKNKPWQSGYHSRFGNIYLHYMNLAGVLG